MHSDKLVPGTTGRPLRPTLATNKTGKSPLTPRLAASATPKSTRSPTPLSRPSARPEAGNETAKNGVRSDRNTPVKAYINSNVTPRSSTRKSRAGSANTTPSGTPSATRPGSSVGYVSASHYTGSVVNGVDNSRTTGVGHAGKARSVVNGGLSNARSPVGAGHGGSVLDTGRDHSMFFHASDIPAHEPSGGIKSPGLKKSPAFFYANGEEEPLPPRSVGVPSPPLSAIGIGRRERNPKFFTADTVNRAKTKSPLPTPPLRAASPEPLALPRNPTRRPPPLRSSSPSKDAHPALRKGAPPSAKSALHKPPVSPASSLAKGARERRRSSLESTISRISHTKSASMSSIDAVASPKRPATANLEGLHTPVPSPLHFHMESAPVSSMPSPNIPEDPLDEETGEASENSRSVEPLGPPLSLPQSPIKSIPSGMQHMHEMAANARRERKVLDLEISNSSLLAINRQLEREVRRQKAELRRFRRLSRAGRLSALTTRSSIGDLSTVADDDDDAASLAPSALLDECRVEDEELTEKEQEPDAEEQDFSDTASESSVASEALSPNALAERDAKHRLKDEKRLQSDLDKHRELLVGSQQMNESLKRCLALTEELIKEGKKALDYQVHISDVKLGGRILEPEEQSVVDESEPDWNTGKTLLGAWKPPEYVPGPAQHDARASSDSTLSTDRDSGVEMEATPKIPPLSPPLKSWGDKVEKKEEKRRISITEMLGFRRTSSEAKDALGGAI